MFNLAADVLDENGEIIDPFQISTIEDQELYLDSSPPELAARDGFHLLDLEYN